MRRKQPEQLASITFRSSGREKEEGYNKTQKILRNFNNSYLLSAQFECDNGRFNYADDICAILLSDDRLRSAAENRISEFISSEIAFEGLQSEILEQGLWWEICPEDILKSIYKQFIMLGWAICQITWEDVDGIQVPHLIFHSAKHYRYDTAEKQWYFIANDGDIKINFGKGGWICFRSESYNFWRSDNGLWGALSLLYLLKNEALNTWGYINSKYGNIMHVLSVSDASTKQKATEAQINALLDDLNSSISRASVYIPYGYSLSRIEPNSATTWQSFKTVIDAANDSFSTLIVGSNLSTNSATGMGAVGDLQRTTNVSRLICDAQVISTQIHSELLLPFFAANSSDGTASDAPWIVFKIINDLREQRMGARAQMIGQAISTLIPALEKNIITDNELRELVGLKPKEVAIPTYENESQTKQLIK